MTRLKICEMLVYLYRIHPDNFFDFSKDSYAKTVIEVQEYLNNNFKETLTLKSVAAHFYTDMYYLSTKFKEIIGYSFKQYLTNLRLSYAKYLLVTTDNTISSICSACGYNDPANFIRAFTSIEKLSPTKYRAKFGEPRR